MEQRDELGISKNKLSCNDEIRSEEYLENKSMFLGINTSEDFKLCNI